MPTPEMLKRMSGVKKTRPNRAGGDGTEFPLRVAKITRVDPKKMVVDLITFTGNNDTYENVALTFPNAGARHFMGAVPEVNDLCIIDYSPAESGTSRRPYIVGWLVPGTEVAYDWVTTQLTNPEDLELTAKERVALEGVYGRRRHKLRQMEAGNVVASSSQGSDLILSEDLLLANRRGNELLLRDSDQSLVIRSLQQFHAGSGFRVYSGMVQRDANLLPRQIFSDGIDYTNAKQLDDEGEPLPLGDLEPSEIEDGKLKVSNVFNQKLYMGDLNPQDILTRGLFIDDEGFLKDSSTIKGATYGGKSFYRVSKDLSNSVLDNGSETFTEYRIEVSHTSDGTLPVTEQTDGIDIDRLPASQVSEDIDNTEPNSQNKAINAPMVEMVLGTAIGNDYINEPDAYGIPLIATMFDENGNYSPAISPAPTGTPVTSHLAWMVRVKNPTGSGQPAFIAITKGGALKQYFPGIGSETFEEYYEKGRTTGISAGKGGVSQKFICSGSFEVSSGTGNLSKNSGISLSSAKGSFNVFAGGYNLEGSSSLSAGQDINLPAAQQIGIQLETPHSIFAKGGKEVRIQGSKKISIEETNTINLSSNNSISMDTDNASFNFKTFDISMQEDTTFTSSGNLSMQFNGGPAASSIGASVGVSVPTGGVNPVWTVSSSYGAYSQTYNIGRAITKVGVGSIVFQSSSSEVAYKVVPQIGTGSGVILACGIEKQQSTVAANLLGVSLKTRLPGNKIKLESSKGGITLKAATKIKLKSSTNIRLSARAVKVSGVVAGISSSVLTDSCKDPLTGRSFLLSGCRGITRFKVGP